MKKVIVWGNGKFYTENEHLLLGQKEILKHVDSFSKCQMVVAPTKEIFEMDYDEILIMVENVGGCFEITSKIFEIAAEESKYDILASKIKWGIVEYGEYSKKLNSLTVLNAGEVRVNICGIEISVANADEFYNTWDTIANTCYDYKLNNTKEDVVVDIGMNIGDATLYFLQRENVRRVYGYEPFCETYEAAKRNLQKYVNSERLQIYPYGIGGKEECRTISYQRDMSCGQSSVEKNKDVAVQIYNKDNLLHGIWKEEVIVLKSVVTELENIVEQHKDNNIILKVDCEGEEFSIFEALVCEELLDKIQCVMLEWHYGDATEIKEILEKFGFSYFSFVKSNNMGLIYAMRK